MFFHPQPFAATNPVRPQSIQIVDPLFARGCPMVGIVLYVQSNQGHAHTIDNRQGVGSFTSPQSLQIEKPQNVQDRPKMISPGTKLATTTDNFEDFFFDLSFKGGIEFVSEVSSSSSSWCWCLEQEHI
jgi:hypothetical protein